MEKLTLACLLIFVSQSYGIGRSISEQDYHRFPPVTHLDRYAHCLMQDGGVFCTADAELYSDEPNELLTMIRNFSESSVRHLNYSRLIYGYCMTKRCKQFYKGNSTTELKEAMEECLTDEMMREYGLRARVKGLGCYYHTEKPRTFDNLDWSMAAVLITIISLSFLGTLYDVHGTDKKKGFLMCFSLRANWRRFKAPWPSDPQSQQLIGINAFRVITSIFVVMSHAFLPHFLANDNTIFHERLFLSWNDQFSLHVHWVMQTFFFLSGLFLVYSMQNASKRVALSWKSLPKAILLRWLRLIPVSLVVLLFTVSWLRYSPKGPMWETVVGDECRDCRKNWIYYVFGINNYVDHVQCLVQTWSNACDLHLHIMGLTIILLSPSKKARNVTLWVAFVISVFWPVYLTITRDLNGILIISTENLREAARFVADPTFMYIYRCSHTNASSFIIGMAFAYKMYDWQEKGITEADGKKYRKYDLLYWCLFPLMYGFVTLAGIFYIMDGPVPMYIRVLFALFQKPVWSILLALIIYGMVFRIERFPLYRGILESHFWVPLSKLSFCLYNVHITVIRFLGGESPVLGFFSFLKGLDILFGVTVLSYILSLAMWLLAEAPLNNLIRLYFPEKSSSPEQSNATKGEYTKVQ